MTEAIKLQSWIDTHRHLLKPPVGNKCIVDGDFIVMIVGGPNHRHDFHVEQGPEFFHQLEGEMVLRIQEQGRVRDIPIRAGEMYYLAPGIPHSPQRRAGSVGLVIERRRLPQELDELRWYCPSCNQLIYQEQFALTDIENQFPAVFARFYDSPEHRLCQRCGTLHPEQKRVD
ncbi:MAG: 3-hydroxyanthranilate 3,4-dioxygenase [Lysobacterales bacterium]